MFELVAEGNRRPLPGAREALAELLPLLGLESLLEAEEGADAEAEGLLAERERARAERDFDARRPRFATSSPSAAGRFATRPDGRAGSCGGG